MLTEGRFQTLLTNPDGDYPHDRIDLHYPADEGLQAAIERVCDEAVAAVRGGAVLLVLSDRAIAPDQLADSCPAGDRRGASPAGRATDCAATLI